MDGAQKLDHVDQIKRSTVVSSGTLAQWKKKLMYILCIGSQEYNKEAGREREREYG